jgi:hypothetical protein
VKILLSAITTGRISELQAIINALKDNYHVCEPVTASSYDLLISKDGVNWTRAQTKTLYYRHDKESYVCFAKKGKNQKYAIDEVDVFLAVNDEDVYVIPHNGNGEHWSKNPETKWSKL